MAAYNPSTGCEPDPKDDRDFPYAEAMGASPAVTEEDWDRGYSAYEHLGIAPADDDQGSSSSCVGRAVAALFRRWTYRLLGESGKKSSKFVYSQIYLPPGGAYIRDGMLLAARLGIPQELTVPSSMPGGKPPTEEFMRDYSPTEQHLREAKSFDLLSCRMIPGGTSDINVFAHAILHNLGVVSGCTGSNVGWTKHVCRHPQPGESKWNHCMDFCAFGRLESDTEITYGTGKSAVTKKYPKGTKCLFTPNSWGGRYTIDKGRWKGYQAIPEEYFLASEPTAAGEAAGVYVFNSWAFVPDTALPMDVKIADLLRKWKGKLIQLTEEGKPDSGRFGFSDGQRLLIAPTSEDRAALMCLTVLIRNGYGTGVDSKTWDRLPKHIF